MTSITSISHCVDLIWNKYLISFKQIKTCIYIYIYIHVLNCLNEMRSLFQIKYDIYKHHAAMCLFDFQSKDINMTSPTTMSHYVYFI